MPIRMTGMVSGLDTDSIVKELVSAYSTKKEKYEKERTKLGWKQEIWKDLNKKLTHFIKVLEIYVLKAATARRRPLLPIRQRQRFLLEAMRLPVHRNCMCFLPRSPVI